jgi:cobalt-zinc-cadmium efflux system outer membrane protein
VTGGHCPLRLAALGWLVLTGCAAAAPEPGPASVQARVEPRLGQPIRWVPGEDEPAVRQAVGDLLARPLTAEAAVQVALLNNRALQADYVALGIARGELLQAGVLENPVLSAEARFGRGTEVSLDVVQNVLSAVTQSARRAAATAGFERTQLELGHRILALAADVRTSYYRLVADEEALGLLRQVVSATEAAAELAERQVQAGTLSRREQSIQQTLYAQVVLELGRAETQQAVDREALNRLLGLWGPETEWQLPDRLPEIPSAMPPLAGLEARAVERRLDLAAARRATEGAGQAADLARSTRYLPSLGVGVASERDSDGTWRTGPRVELGLPLWEQGQGRVTALEAERQRQLQGATALAIAIRSEVREGWQRLAAAQAAARHFQGVLLPLSQRIVDETQRLYNGMLVGVYDLIRSKQDQIATAREYVAAIRDYWVARAELERALGGPLE